MPSSMAILAASMGSCSSGRGGGGVWPSRETSLVGAGPLTSSSGRGRRIEEKGMRPNPSTWIQKEMLRLHSKATAIAGNRSHRRRAIWVCSTRKFCAWPFQRLGFTSPCTRGTKEL